MAKVPTQLSEFTKIQPGNSTQRQNLIKDLKGIRLMGNRYPTGRIQRKYKKEFTNLGLKHPDFVRRNQAPQHPDTPQGTQYSIALFNAPSQVTHVIY